MAKKEKGAFWEMIVYPESAPDDWQDRIKQLGIKGFFSMLHDKDVYESDDEGHKAGEPKKAHYHVVLCWDGPTTRSNAFSVAQLVNTSRLIRVQNPAGRWDYMNHKGYVNKFQYSDPNEPFNGFNYLDYKRFSREDNRVFRYKCLELIRTYNIMEYFQLLDLLEECCEDELHDYAWNHTIALRAYIDGRRYQQQNKEG